MPKQKYSYPWRCTKSYVQDGFCIFDGRNEVITHVPEEAAELIVKSVNFFMEIDFDTQEGEDVVISADTVQVINEVRNIGGGANQEHHSSDHERCRSDGDVSRMYAGLIN